MIDEVSNRSDRFLALITGCESTVDNNSEYYCGKMPLSGIHNFFQWTPRDFMPSDPEVVLKVDVYVT